MSIRLGIFIAICVAFIAIGTFIKFAHHKVITEGEFLGLVIGETKEEVFSTLIEQEHVSYVRGETVEYITISQENIGDLYRINDLEAFIISGPQTQIKVYLDDGIIAKISRAGIGDELKGDYENIDQMLPEIDEFLKGNSERGVFNIVKGYGISYKLDEVSLNHEDLSQNMDGYNWLLTQDHWLFDGEEPWTYIDIYFEDGQLQKIEYTNNFTELP